MNRQEVFDKVLKAIVKQGKPSLNKYQNCCYRGEGGTKCAIGHLIPDELYRESFESCIPNYRFEPVKATLGFTVTQEDERFLGDLQVVHDSNDLDILEETGQDFVTSFKFGMKNLAQKWELNYDNT